MKLYELFGYPLKKNKFKSKHVMDSNSFSIIAMENKKGKTHENIYSVRRYKNYIK